MRLARFAAHPRAHVGECTEAGDHEYSRGKAEGEARAAGSNALALDVTGVHFGYGGGREVLDGVTLKVPAGTCTCLMGVNGCGKSTLLDCVLGVHVPASGEVSVCGQAARALRPAQLARLVAYVPQVHERSFPYKVRHVVLMGRTAHARGLGAPDPADAHLATRALAACGIAHLAERPYTGLSGGEMQMVMLARALAQDTPVILMDEPTAHLDFRNEVVFLETVEQLVRERGVAVLMATHAPNQAFHLAEAGVPTRVALMRGGRVAREGAPREVLDEDSLREVFGVQACLLEGWVDEWAETAGRTRRPIRQIAPLRSVVRDDAL